MIMDGTIIKIAIIRKQSPLKSKWRTVSEYKELNIAAPISVQIVSTVATAAKSAPAREESIWKCYFLLSTVVS